MTRSRTPTATPKTPGARLQQARIAARFASARAACEAHGWSLSTYSQHESDVRGLKRAAADYASAFGVTADWLLFGDDPPPAAGRLVARQHSPAGIVAAGDRLPVTADPGALEWVAFTEDARGSAVPFTAAMLAHIGVAPGAGRVCRVDESNAPADLSPGDWVLYDTDDTNPARAGRFVVSAGAGVLAVLHLQTVIGMTPPSVHVSVPGPYAHQYVVPLAQLDVLGRVKWLGKAVH